MVVQYKNNELQKQLVQGLSFRQNQFFFQKPIAPTEQTSNRNKHKCTYKEVETR